MTVSDPDTFASRRDAFLRERYMPYAEHALSDPGHTHTSSIDVMATHAISPRAHKINEVVLPAGMPPSGEMASDPFPDWNTAEERARKMASLLQYVAPTEAHLEMLSSTDVGVADSFAKLRVEYHKLLADIDGPFGYKARIGELCAEIRVLSAHPWVAVNAVADDAGPKADYHGPDDAAHRAVHNVTEHLLGGRVTSPKARAGLRDALDKADRPAEGRAKSDQAIGRTLRLQDAQMSSTDPGFHYDPTTNRTYGVPACPGFGAPDQVKIVAAAVPSAKAALPSRALGRGAQRIGLSLP